MNRENFFSELKRRNVIWHGAPGMVVAEMPAKAEWCDLRLNRRTDLQGYAAWEIHAVMKLDVR